MANVFVKYPKPGDHVVGRLSDKKKLFISAESFDLSSLDTETYEVVGYVARRRGREVLWGANSFASKQFISKLLYQVSDYTLDGETHTVSVSYTASSSATAVTLEFEYAATTLDELAEQINTAIAGDEAFTAASFEAHVEDDVLYLSQDYLAGLSATWTGLTMTNATLPDLSSVNWMRRKNGSTATGNGALWSLARAKVYFASDRSDTSFNPSSDVTSIRRQFPVCLPAYLGDSSYQSDHCAFLRAYYGEGEEGWLKHLESCMAVNPIDCGGVMNIDGYANTEYMAAYEINGVRTCSAAVYCHDYETETVEAGEMYLATPRDICDIFKDDVYTAINAALAAQGKSSLSNSTHYWSCARYSAYNAWNANGSSGYFISGSMHYSNRCLPVSLLQIED